MAWKPGEIGYKFKKLVFSCRQVKCINSTTKLSAKSLGRVLKCRRILAVFMVNEFLWSVMTFHETSFFFALKGVLTKRVLTKLLLTKRVFLFVNSERLTFYRFQKFGTFEEFDESISDSLKPAVLYVFELNLQLSFFQIQLYNVFDALPFSSTKLWLKAKTYSVTRFLLCWKRFKTL